MFIYLTDQFLNKKQSNTIFFIRTLYIKWKTQETKRNKQCVNTMNIKCHLLYQDRTTHNNIFVTNKSCEKIAKCVYGQFFLSELEHLFLNKIKRQGLI